MSCSKLAGTKTEANLKEAFAGESQARNKYTYFASQAKKDGYEEIAAIFLETADNEKNTQRFGSKSFAASVPLLKTSKPLRKVKTKNILLCIPEWLRKRKKKALMISPSSLKALLKSKPTMKPATEIFWLP